MIASLVLAAAAIDLTTFAERSAYARTGRYDEVISLCADFERAFRGKAACLRWGTSPEGRPLLALAASEDGVLGAAAARKKGRPAIVLQGGIHAGEIDGKDAGFRVLWDTLEGRVAPGVLRAVTVVFIPVLNADGHERFSRWNRPNQRGPEEMGWRTTAQNLNLNRDYAKAEAPEMQALLALLLDWDPVLYVDLHATDGAKFRHDVSITTDPAEMPAAPLRELARKLRGEVVRALAEQGHLPIEFYPAFVEDDDPASGFAVGSAPPRLSTPYWGWRDRLGLLVETHSWRTYPERVRATQDTLDAILERAREDAAAWRAAARAADAAQRDVGGTEVALAFAAGETRRTIDFLGYAYRREPSSISGTTRIVYDESQPATWQVPLVTDTEAVAVVRAPRAGYLVAPAHAALFRDKLTRHGFRTLAVARERKGVPVEVFETATVEFEALPYEGRQRVKVRGAWTREARDVPAGSLFVPVAQPAARLLIHLLEPVAPDSLVAWGFVNAVFEQKEYIESYVVEELAGAMLREDPALREEFVGRLAADPAFARSPKQRLEFFYRRSPYWDSRKDVVPILRVDAW
jgi:hypothetical protein